jgi:AICAR transformylase/IMP cyclohydrolase PurH
MALKPVTKAAAAKLVNSTVLFNLIDRLSARWQDEKEYEDIAEYGKAIAAKLPPEVAFVKMLKRPFGPVLMLPDYEQPVQLYIKTKSSTTCVLAMKTYTGRK